MESNSLYSGISTVKNLKGEFIWVSNEAIKLIGLSKYEQKTDFDLPCAASEYAETFQQQDKKALTTGPLIIMDVHVYSSGLHAILTEKKPFYNDSKLIGVICNSICITHKSLISKLIHLDQDLFYRELIGSYYVGENNDDPRDLTEREQEILFYAIRGFSAKNIGRELNISSKIVEFHIDTLKNKFSANNEQELISIALKNDYLKYIPASFTKYY